MKLTDKELKDISSAVKKAESKTSGEIATAVIKESSDYAFYELAFSIIMGALTFVLTILFSSSIESWLKSLFWTYNQVYLITFTGLLIFFVVGVSYLISNIPVIDRFIIPNKIMEEKVYNRALRHFIESGTCYTKDRTGILIFVSKLERKVILLADKGINEKIDQNSWDSIIKNIIKGIKTDEFSKSLIQSIRECGELLKKEFPIKSDDENELTDDIQVLEK